MVVIEKTEMEHRKRLTTKEEKYAFSPQTVSAADQHKWSIRSGGLITQDRAKLHKKLNEELKYNVQKAIYDTLQKVHAYNLDISTDFKIVSIKDV